MNNDKLQRLDKLTAEYHDLNGKISRLDAFINHINFETTVHDAEERMRMCHQLTAMSSYRTNLKARIYLLKAQLEQDMDKNGPQVQEHQCGQDTRRRDEAAAKLCDLLVKGHMAVYAPREKCAKCGGDLLNGLGAKDGDKTICFNCANQITNEELQQALDEYRAARLNHCGQDATCQVGDGSAVVNEIPDSLKSLEGMQVIKVCGPKCKDCPCGDGLREYPSGRDASSCVKVELVGGYYICLAPLPNSIVTE